MYLCELAYHSSTFRVKTDKKYISNFVFDMAVIAALRKSREQTA